MSDKRKTTQEELNTLTKEELIEAVSQTYRVIERLIEHGRNNESAITPEYSAGIVWGYEYSLNILDDSFLYLIKGKKKEV